MGIYGEFNIEQAVAKMEYDRYYRIDPNKPLYELMMFEFKKRIDTHRDLQFWPDYSHICRIETAAQLQDQEFQQMRKEQRYLQLLAIMDSVNSEMISARQKPEYQWPITVKQLKEQHRNKNGK